MKRLIAFVILTVLAAALVGCTTSSSTNSSGLFTPVPAGPTKYPIAGPYEPLDPGQLITTEPTSLNEALAWGYTRLGGTAGDGMSYQVFTDYPSYYKELGSAADKLADKIDDRSFLSSFVVVIYINTPTGGYTFSVEKAVIENGTANIKLASELAPGSHTTAFEKHAIVISFSNSVYSPDLVYKIEGGAGFTGTVSE